MEKENLEYWKKKAAEFEGQVKLLKEVLQEAQSFRDQEIQERNTATPYPKSVRRHKKSIDEMSDAEINALIDKKRKKK